MLASQIGSGVSVGNVISYSASAASNCTITIPVTPNTRYLIHHIQTSLDDAGTAQTRTFSIVDDAPAPVTYFQLKVGIFAAFSCAIPIVSKGNNIIINLQFVGAGSGGVQINVQLSVQ